MSDDRRTMTSGRTKRALVGVVLAVVSFIAINALADSAFRRMSWDVTDEGLYTLSDSTRQVLSEIDEPVTLRLYFSSLLGERAPGIKTYHQRVASLLEQYADLADGMVQLEYYDPEPYSVVEDRAVSFGLEGFPVTDAGDRGYFGLAATNATDDVETIPFFSQDREEFIEYDLTRIVHSLSNPDLPSVGILTTIPMVPPDGRSPPMAVMEQMREFFEVSFVDQNASELPDGIDVLMIVNPHDLTDGMIYSIDQFVLAGGRALVFADPVAEVGSTADAQGQTIPGRSDFNRLLNRWGVNLADGVVAGDLETARRVSVQDGGQLVAIDYVGWLSLGAPQFDASDAIMSELSIINVATAGVLDTLEGGPKVTPLITTGGRSMRIDSSRFTGAEIDAVDLFNTFKPSDERLTIAARISGDVETAFPDGLPDGVTEPASGHLVRSAKPANIVVVSDVDMLSNQMWLDRRALLGQTIDIPLANNADFVVNAIDNLAGSSALISLRGRSSTSRPFTLIESIRQDSEVKYRAREQDLKNRLTEIEAELQSLVDRADASGNAEGVVVSDAERERIDTFRGEMLDIRADLRGVRHALRQDIESINDRIKLINIALVPVLLTAAAIATALIRRRRRRVRVEQA